MMLRFFAFIVISLAIMPAMAATTTSQALAHKQAGTPVTADNWMISAANPLAVEAGAHGTLDYTIKEGEKERTQFFQGTVLQRRGSGATETFTIRKVSGGVGVERIFPLASPFIEKIEVNKHGSVRRARIFYLRERTGESARIKEQKIIKK